MTNSLPISLANLELRKEPAGELPLEMDRLLAEGTVQSSSNSNGYVMRERHQPPNQHMYNSVVLEEGGRTTPSQRSCRSNISSRSTRSSLDIAKCDRDQLQNIGILGKYIMLICRIDYSLKCGVE